jgi:hypothetical protein
MDELEPHEIAARERRRKLTIRYGAIVAALAAVVIVAVVVSGGDDETAKTTTPSVVVSSEDPTTPLSAAPSTDPAQTAPVSAPTDVTPPSETTPAVVETAVNGTVCGPDVRQFDFTPYAPACVAKFEGDNGGATAKGVTADEISVVYRQTDDGDAIAPNIGAPTAAQLTADATVLAAYFNTQYELYGRSVVIKTFEGGGSFLVEAAGGGQDGANADAQALVDMGTFATGGDEVGSFADALASHEIVHMSVPRNLSTFTDTAPFRYQALGPVIDHAAYGIADLICQRMADLPAIFAGDDATKSTTRKFAVIHQEQGQDAALLISHAKEVCGVDVESIKYIIGPATYAAQTSQIATRLKADGITTVVMFTDPLFGTSFTTAAVAQQYTPEWLLAAFNSNFWPRQADPKAVESLIAVYPWQPQNQPPQESGCYKIYKQQSPDTEPATGYNIEAMCAHYFQFFGALQAAGPNLTPATFATGWFAQAESVEAGPYGQWSFGKEMFSPDSTFILQTWKAGVTNPFDGGVGQYVACDEDPNIPYLKVDIGSGQLKCFGG